MASKIVYNREILREFSRKIKKCQEDLIQSTETLNNDFSGLNSLGYTRNVIKGINKYSNSITNYNEADIFSKNVEDQFEINAKAASDFEAMEIPQHFTANNSMEMVNYNKVILETIEKGKVKEDGGAEKASYDDETVVAAESLTDITKAGPKKTSYNDDTTVVGKSVLGSLSTNQAEKAAFDDSTSVGNTKLKNINNGVVTTQEFDGNISVENQALNSINNDNEIKIKTYDETSVVGKSVLGDLDFKEKINQDDTLVGGTTDLEENEPTDVEKEV